MIGKIIGILILGGTGILLIVLGFLLWKKEKINLMHDYHVNKVAPENRAAFCKLSGIGLIVMGIGMLISTAVLGFTDSNRSLIPFAFSFVVGLVLLIIAGLKYNR
ncbi:MAG: DUF3784 domain-containing protein [Lachnospiraceae bacterium]|nr:DUF3784 domain-containing protein [Lachnospiraceae bacterium]